MPNEIVSLETMCNVHCKDVDLIKKMRNRWGKMKELQSAQKKKKCLAQGAFFCHGKRTKRSDPRIWSFDCRWLSPAHLMRLG